MTTLDAHGPRTGDRFQGDAIGQENVDDTTWVWRDSRKEALTEEHMGFMPGDSRRGTASALHQARPETDRPFAQLDKFDHQRDPSYFVRRCVHVGRMMVGLGAGREGVVANPVSMMGLGPGRYAVAAAATPFTPRSKNWRSSAN